MHVCITTLEANNEGIITSGWGRYYHHKDHNYTNTATYTGSTREANNVTNGMYISIGRNDFIDAL